MTAPPVTSSRRRTLIRCARCRMSMPVCLCAILPRIDTHGSLVLVPHQVEWRRASNTGRLAVLCLRRSELAIYGVRDRPLEPESLHRPDVRHVLLYPGVDAPLLRPDPNRPTRVIVPDGSWRQAARMARVIRTRIPGEIHLARVEASPLRVLRRMPSATRLSTGSAIVAALDALEETEAARALDEALGWMVDRSLFVRGLLRGSEVRGGLDRDTRRALAGFVAG